MQTELSKYYAVRPLKLSELLYERIIVNPIVKIEYLPDDSYLAKWDSGRIIHRISKFSDKYFVPLKDVYWESDYGKYRVFKINKCYFNCTAYCSDRRNVTSFRSWDSFRYFTHYWVEGNRYEIKHR